MRETTTVGLKAMRFQTRVGVLPEERSAEQPIEVDISVVCAEGRVGYLDYREIYDAASTCVSSGHHDLLEDIAAEISNRLERLGGVRSTRVAIRKMLAPLPGPLQYSEVVVERSFDE
jgi:dihydroneopterin aldolase/2-amino-4-hydroxy-6-hydroxymethyldihydropteridine diphosphokinase